MNYENILMYQDMIDTAFESDDTSITTEGYSKAHKARVLAARREQRMRQYESAKDRIESSRKIGSDIFPILRVLHAVHEKKGIATARKFLLSLFEWARSNEGQNGQPDEIYNCVKKIRKMFAAGLTEDQIGRDINAYARLRRFPNGTGSWHTTSAAQRAKYMDEVRNYKD